MINTEKAFDNIQHPFEIRVMKRLDKTRQEHTSI